MSKLFGKAFRRYQEAASSISLLPDDDFDLKFSHSIYVLEEKAMKKTAKQMENAFVTFLIENPQLIEDLKDSCAYANDDNLKLEFDEQVESAQKYVNKRQYKFAF